MLRVETMPDQTGGFFRMAIVEAEDGKEGKIVFKPNKLYPTQHAARRNGQRYLKRYHRTGSFDPPVNVNTATVEEIARLGLTLVQAAQIVQERTDKGIYRGLQDMKDRTRVDDKALDAQAKRIAF